MVLYQNLILFNACIFNFLCEGDPNMSMSMSVLRAQFSSLFSFFSEQFDSCAHIHVSLFASSPVRGNPVTTVSNGSGAVQI